MDITSINKRVRDYLDEQGLDMVEPQEPMWDGTSWHVLITFDDQPRGTVILDADGEVIKYKPFGLDKHSKIG